MSIEGDMYSTNGLPDREAIVTRYAELVKKIAYHLLGRLPPNVQVDDLIQAGMIGLLDSADHYDPSQGASFETYASIRIRGSMLDELRRADWAPKSVHRKTREMTAAIQRIETFTGRTATDREIADELGVDIEQYYQLLQDISGARLVSFDEATSPESGGYDRFSDKGPMPIEQLQDEEFRRNLQECIRQLSEREQMIMSLYYDQDLNLKEIGAVLGVSESRISQLLSRIHAQLRAALAS